MVKSFKLVILCTLLTLFVAVSANAFSNQDNPGVAGKVVETMSVDAYTYVLVDNGGGMQMWAAVPKCEVSVGESVEVAGGMIMQNFTSKSLNRTFPAILFAGGLQKN